MQALPAKAMVITMSEIRLKIPTAEYAEQIMAYRKEFLDNNSEMDGCNGLHKCECAEDWLEKIEKMRIPETCPKNISTATQYIAVRESDDKLVGMIDLRHHIDHPILSFFGGHIGYSVLPSERRKGYAKEMLRQCLEKAKERGLHYVMVTCVQGNLGSEKTILANGGVLQRETFVPERDETLKVFWMELQ